MKNKLEIEFQNDYYHNDNATIRHMTENWSISIDTLENGGTTDRELAEITIKMPNGKMWRGTIQDFKAIFDYATNALTELHNYNSAGFTDSESQQEVTTAIEELQTLLGHVE